MSHLLGNEDCLKSLSQDVADISRVISEVLSRTGPLRVRSWKFPDKIATDLHVDDILERYAFSEDDELDNQVSHFSLLELLIDRLLLALHCATAFGERIAAPPSVSSSSARPLAADASAAPTSAGLIVKKFWLKVVKISTAVAQLRSESSTSDREVAEMRAKILELKEELEKTAASGRAALAIAESGNSAVSSVRVETAGCVMASAFGEGATSSSSTRGSMAPSGGSGGAGQSVKFAFDALSAARQAPCPNIGNDSSQRGCQTTETAFAPCGACHEAQSHVRGNGEALMDVCKRLEVPPSAHAAAQRGQVSRDGWLTPKELSGYNEEQGRCLSKLCSFFEVKLKENVALKEALVKLEGDFADRQSREEKLTNEFSRDRGDWVLEKKQYAAKITETERHCAERIKDMQTYLNKVLLEKDQANIKERKAREDVAMRERLIATVKEDKKRVARDKEAAEEDATNARRRLEEMEDLLKNVRGEKELADVERESAQKTMRKMDATMSVLDKKATSLLSQEEMFVRRIDRLTEENENLVKELEEAENRLDRLQEERESGIGAGGVARVEEAERRMRALEKQVSAMTSERAEAEARNAELRDRLREAKEQQRLLVAFPDLNGPVRGGEEASDSVSSSMESGGVKDVASDMRKQLRANELRIEVLQDENERLQEAVAKMAGSVEESRILDAIHRSESKTGVPRVPPSNELRRSTSQGNMAPWRGGDAGRESRSKSKSLSATTRLFGGRGGPSPPRRSMSYESQSRASPPFESRTLPTRAFESRTLPPNAFNMSDEAKENIAHPNRNSAPFPPPPKRGAAKVGVAWNAREMRGGAATFDRSKSATAPKSGLTSAATAAAFQNQRAATMNPSAVDAYRQLKNSSYIKAPGGRPPGVVRAAFANSASGKNYSVGAKSHGKAPPPKGLDLGVFSCPKCDKMYTSAKDLDVHKIYCLAALATNF